jgi:hypothetical protein
MQRQEAVRKASKFLGREEDIKTGSTAKAIKKRAKKNPDLNRAALTQIIADVFQLGLSPKDIDFQKIDFGVSYSNIRSQVKDLAKKRSGAEFESDKTNRIESGRAKADAMAANARSKMLSNKASFIERGNPVWSRFVDQSKQAEKKFSKPFTKEEYRKWRRNQDKYDMQGIDSKRPRDERVKVENYPFEKSNKDRIKEMMMENSLAEGFERSQNSYADKLSKKEVVDKKQKLRKKTGRKLGSSKKFSFKESNASKMLSDSRSDSELKVSNKGGSSDRSNQQSLRDGFASKKSEKTLDKWKNNYY